MGALHAALQVLVVALWAPKVGGAHTKRLSWPDWLAAFLLFVLIFVGLVERNQWFQ